MKNRSRIHMLTVAAARLQDDYANPKLIEDLRAAAAEEASKKVQGRSWSPEEERRVERQRTLFAMLPSLGATDRLREAMMQRAYDLMWDGLCTECDTLLEWLPSAGTRQAEPHPRPRHRPPEAHPTPGQARPVRGRLRAPPAGPQEPDRAVRAPDAPHARGLRRHERPGSGGVTVRALSHIVYFSTGLLASGSMVAVCLFGWEPPSAFVAAAAFLALGLAANARQSQIDD